MSKNYLRYRERLRRYTANYDNGHGIELLDGLISGNRERLLKLIRRIAKHNRKPKGVVLYWVWDNKRERLFHSSAIIPSGKSGKNIDFISNYEQRTGLQKVNQ